MWVVSEGGTWSSTDGIIWVPVPSNFPDTPTSALVVHSGKMWVIGVASVDYWYSEASTWSTSDGMTWDLVNRDAPFNTYFGHTSLAFNNRLWVLGGSRGGDLRDVWSSGDGQTWIQHVDQGYPFQNYP